jgi:hypothetical protein
MKLVVDAVVNDPYVVEDRCDFLLCRERT